MEIQTIDQNKQMPVRLAATNTLPESLVNSLPPIVKASITQLPLRQIYKRNPNQLNVFCVEVIGKLNITMQDPAIEAPVLNSEIMRYAEQSKITPAEFFIARTLLSRGMLADVDGEIMKPYKRIDYETFNQVEEAYLRFKEIDKAYENGLKKINKFLNPPPPEPTPEEIKAKRARLIEDIKQQYLTFGHCEYGFMIYEDLKETGVLDPFRARERTKPIQNRLMSKFLAVERGRNLFYNKVELERLAEAFRNNTGYRIPEIVKQEVRNEILKNYFQSNKKY